MLERNVAPTPGRDHFLDLLLGSGGREMPGREVLATGARAPGAGGREPPANERQTNPKDNGQATGWGPEQNPRRATVQGVGEAPYVLSKAARDMCASNTPAGAKGDALAKRASRLDPLYRGNRLYEKMLLGE